MKKFKSFLLSDEFGGYLICLLPLYGAIALMPIWRDSSKSYFIGDIEAWIISALFFIVTGVVAYANYDFNRK